MSEPTNTGREATERAAANTGEQEREQSAKAAANVPADVAKQAHANGWSLHALEQNSWAHVQHSPLGSMWDLQGVPVLEVAKRTWTGIDEDNLFGRASQLAYSFFSAIFPALIAMSSLMGLIAQSSGKLYYELLGKIGQLIPPTAFALVTDTFQKTTSASTTGKVTFGLLFALFSASVGISAIQDTLNSVYNVKETRPFWKARLQAMGLTLMVAALVIVALLTLFTGDWAANHMEGLFRGAYVLAMVFRVCYWAIACLLMVLSFEVMYYFCPDVQNRKWRWFTPGGCVGLLGWVVGSIGLRIYLHYFNSYSVTYGSLGAVIILLLWFYLTGAMILLGGEVNSEIEHAVAEKKLLNGECPLPPASAVGRVDVNVARKAS
ncbi:putative membrane protein [Terriglobus roseus DSM 18391]|uniref:Putative membrane protein n=1 Tax=Terriglobus roseus (strain DSM 18391 / NRRL B-41598 / KBS 63) TaxID=926566 RepID=I3ZD27_TERRK|nr:YihY/virulence factor BrkB family protein [Terriglobus roseus]AFL87145.1 putative membrane protein [Terriglobus roseus DSM 18391]